MGFARFASSGGNLPTLVSGATTTLNKISIRYLLGEGIGFSSRMITGKRVCRDLWAVVGDKSVRDIKGKVGFGRGKG